MKKLIFILVLNVLICGEIFGQIDLRNDSFKFRNDVTLSYNLYVKNNDMSLNGSLIKLTKAIKLGPNSVKYNLSIIDSNYIMITDTVLSSYIDYFQYYGRDSSGNIDSAIVSFEKKILTGDMYPGDANNDNLVNHFDLFPIGLMYNKYGDPRHNLDTGISFTPKKVNNWLFQSGTINAKFADIDGNSVINDRDYKVFQSNIGLSRGTYTPKLSDTTGALISSIKVVELFSRDTIYFGALDTMISFKIQTQSSSSVGSYGLGFSLSVLSQNNTLGDTLYAKYRYNADVSVWNNNLNQLSVVEKITKPLFTNVAFCRNNQTNGGLGGEAGVVEVMVEDVLIGMKNYDDIRRIKINLSDVALIDNNYNYLPIKPISKTVYLRKLSSSIVNSQVAEKIIAYPTLVEDLLIVEKLNPKALNFEIYNSIGQVIKTGILNAHKTIIDNIEWSPGIYLLKIENSNEVIRLKKY